MSRADLIRKAQLSAGQAFAKAPYMFPLETVIDQLQYLLDLETGKISDKTRLKTIIIGQIAARDIENFDSDLANLLHDVSAQAREMAGAP